MLMESAHDAQQTGPISEKFIELKRKLAETEARASKAELDLQSERVDGAALHRNAVSSAIKMGEMRVRMTEARKEQTKAYENTHLEVEKAKKSLQDEMITLEKKSEAKIRWLEEELKVARDRNKWVWEELRQARHQLKDQDSSEYFARVLEEAERGREDAEAEARALQAILDVERRKHGEALAFIQGCRSEDVRQTLSSQAQLKMAQEENNFLRKKISELERESAYVRKKANSASVDLERTQMAAYEAGFEDCRTLAAQILPEAGIKLLRLPILVPPESSHPSKSNQKP